MVNCFTVSSTKLSLYLVSRYQYPWSTVILLLSVTCRILIDLIWESYQHGNHNSGRRVFRDYCQQYHLHYWLNVHTVAFSNFGIFGHFWHFYIRWGWEWDFITYSLSSMTVNVSPRLSAPSVMSYCIQFAYFGSFYNGILCWVYFGVIVSGISFFLNLKIFWMSASSVMPYHLETLLFVLFTLCPWSTVKLQTFFDFTKWFSVI